MPSGAPEITSTGLFNFIPAYLHRLAAHEAHDSYNSKIRVHLHRIPIFQYSRPVLRADDAWLSELTRDYRRVTRDAAFVGDDGERMPHEWHEFRPRHARHEDIPILEDVLLGVPDDLHLAADYLTATPACDASFDLGRRIRSLERLKEASCL